MVRCGSGLAADSYKPKGKLQETKKRNAGKRVLNPDFLRFAFLFPDFSSSGVASTA